jgi:glycosyltransferase involved in cell wall biosynthesis
MINYEFPPLGGGGGVACYQMARELARNYQMDYLTTGFKELPKFEVIDGIRIHRVSVLGRKELSTATFLSMLTFFPSSLLTGIKLCRRNGYNLIWTWFVIPSGVTSVLLSKLFSVPHILTIIGGDVYDPSKRWSPHKFFLLRKIVNWIMNNSKIITSISTDTKRRALQYYKTNTAIKPVPLGFVKHDFKKVIRRELGLSDEDIILISVGRLIKRKGYEYAIQAVSKLPYQNIVYLIIGDGPEEKNLTNLVKKLKMERKVKFLGFVSEEKKFQYLFVSDIYVLSSLHEGFGICLLEAMYCSMPIVATDNGGQTDFLVNGVNALLLPIKNSGILAEKIVQSIENNNLRNKMAENNRRDIKKYYIKNIAKGYEKLFWQHIQGKA